MTVNEGMARHLLLQGAEATASLSAVMPPTSLQTNLPSVASNLASPAANPSHAANPAVPSTVPSFVGAVPTGNPAPSLTAPGILAVPTILPRKASQIRQFYKTLL